MTVSGINGNVNACYPKYLEDKKKRALSVAIPGSLASLSGAACHFTKNSFATKNPKLLFALTMLTFVGSLFGFGAAAKAQKELNNFNKQNDILNVKV
mgnify:CR=1 FL=1